MGNITSFFQRSRKHLRRGQNESNSGQAIILIALAAIGLIAVMGLAIDGGRLLFLNRKAQTAADAAALAAARSLCEGKDYELAALGAAEANGFDNNQEDNWVTVASPPSNYYSSTSTGIAAVIDLDEANSDAIEDTLTLASLSLSTQTTDADNAPSGSTSLGVVDPCSGCFVEVSIESQIPASFIGLVYDGPLETTSSAIGTCNPDMTVAASTSMRALWARGTSDQCANASISVTGASVEINGGVHSNGKLQINASSGACSCGYVGQVVGESSYVDSVKNQKKVDWIPGDNGYTNIVTSSGLPCSSACFDMSNTVDEDSYPNVNPYKTSVKDDYPVDYDITQYRPTGTIAQEALAKGEYYEYPCKNSNDKMTTTWLTEQGLLDSSKNLKSGIYYSACGIHTGNGSVGWDDLTGTVTFVAEGDIHIDGARHHLDPYIDDLLVFSNSSSNGMNAAVHFSGSSNSWTGNIFAPNGNFQTSGSSNNTNNGCILAQCINFSGSNNYVNCETPADEITVQPGIWLAE